MRVRLPAAAAPRTLRSSRKEPPPAPVPALPASQHCPLRLRSREVVLRPLSSAPQRRVACESGARRSETSHAPEQDFAVASPVERLASTSLSVLCVAEEFDLRTLKRGLGGVAWAGQPRRVDAEVLCIPVVSTPDGAVYVFSFGVAVAWGVGAEAEEAVLSTLLSTVGVTVSPLSSNLRERDAFEVSLSAPGSGLCSISNDVILLAPSLLGGDAQLAVSFAVAQSTKLSVFETRVVRLSEACAHIPTSLAAAGDVRMPRREVTRLTGQLFLQRSAVNLLSSVLDVPAFFWDAADDLQEVYASVTKYLEIKSRVSVLNTRYSVLESMLAMLQVHQADQHSSRLEWIIIWLILIEILLGLAELWLLQTGAIGGH